MNRLARLFLFAAGIAAAQTPAPTFRTGTELIQVSVIAQDKNGKPVTDLKAEDFSLFDNGSPRGISTFAFEQAEPAAPEVSAPNVFTNQIATSPGRSSGPHSGYSVILIDNLLASFGDPYTQEEGTPLARNQTLKMLQSMPADEKTAEKIAIYAITRKPEIVCEFTSDRELLESRLRVWTPGPDNPDSTGQAFVDALEGAGPNEAGFIRKQQAEASRIDMLERGSAATDQMEAIADHLAGIPGRKNLIWLSNRFAMTGRALEKFRRANVAIYPVDMDGVCRLCSPRPIEMMNAMAAATGGLAFYHRNDIDVAIREAVDDGRVSYTLGFYQSAESSAPRVHQLAVKVNRPDVTLRYRTTYQTNSPKPPQVSATELIAALYRPVNETAIPFRATVTRTQNALKLETRLDVASLDLAAQQGRWTGKIECMIRFLTAGGKPVGGEDPQTMTLNLRPATYDAALKDGLPLTRELKIPPGAVELRLLFANRETGKIGTLTIPLSAIQ